MELGVVPYDHPEEWLRDELAIARGILREEGDALPAFRAMREVGERRRASRWHPEGDPLVRFMRSSGARCPIEARIALLLYLHERHGLWRVPRIHGPRIREVPRALGGASDPGRTRQAVVDLYERNALAATDRILGYATRVRLSRQAQDAFDAALRRPTAEDLRLTSLLLEEDLLLAPDHYGDGA